jgi:carbon-monoxide dehydrogenase large subunit
MNDTAPAAIGPWVGRSLKRREDQRLLTGQGQFVADIVRMLHAVLVRSPLADARIRSVDVARTKAAPGVVDALNGADLQLLLPPVPEGQIALPPKWTTVNSTPVRPEEIARLARGWRP